MLSCRGQHEKTTPNANQPAIGCAGEENARAILGTVPVEADGSACFEVPARRPVLFHALTADGTACQVMRTLTYVQPGKRVACVGCHENRRHAAPPARPLAVRRSPSVIEPGPMGGVPFSHVRFVQPVLDRHCIACHGKDKTGKGVDLTAAPGAGGFTKSYTSLTRNAQFVPRYAARNGVQVTPPGGADSARGSGLLKSRAGAAILAEALPKDVGRDAGTFLSFARIIAPADPSALVPRLGDLRRLLRTHTEGRTWALDAIAAMGPLAGEALPDLRAWRSDPALDARLVPRLDAAIAAVSAPVAPAVSVGNGLPPSQGHSTAMR